MLRTAKPTVCLILSCCVLAGPAWAEPASDFEQVYGEQVRKVTATTDTRDDAELAKTLLEAGKTAKGNAALQAMIYTKAYELGMKNVAGHPAAIEAMQQLAEADPQRRAACLEKVLPAAQALFARSTGATKQKAGEDLVDTMMEVADAKIDARKSAEAVALLQRAAGLAVTVRAERAAEIQYNLYEAQARAKVDQKFNALTARLAKDAQDAESRNQLVLIETAEYEDLAAAAKLLTGDVDETVRTYVPLAAKKLDETPEASCLELGEWYNKLTIEGGSIQGRLNALARAVEYYTRFLDLHKQAGAPLLLARKNLDQAQEEIRTLEDKLADAQGGLPGFLKHIKVLSEGRNVGNRMAMVFCGKTIVQTTTGEDNRGVMMAAFHGGKLLSTECFNTHDDREAAGRLAQALAALPHCTYVVLAVRHDGVRGWNDRAQDAVKSIGGKIALAKQPEYNSYYCIGRKGLAPGQAVERCAAASLCYPPGSVEALKISPRDVIADEIRRNWPGRIPWPRGGRGGGRGH